MDLYATIVRFFQEGGLFMYPIAIILMIGLAITIERWMFLTGASSQNRRALKQLSPLIARKDHATLYKTAKGSKAPVSKVITAGVQKFAESKSSSATQFAVEEGIMDVSPNFEKRTHYLATLANIATLLGLLGTIIGLIAAFSAVSNADPSEKASLLSQSISVAMNTTAFGLMVAIPLLMTHAWLQSKSNELLDSLDRAGVKIINSITDR